MALPRPRPAVSLVLALAVTAPGIVVRLGGAGRGLRVVRSALFGLAIVGASLMLTWAAEAAQLDLPPGVAIAGLALIAVLPEYVVGATFAWRGGHAVARFGAACRPPGSGGAAPCGLALANMLGANRLLIGIGWSLVVLVAWHRHRGSSRPL